MLRTELVAPSTAVIALIERLAGDPIAADGRYGEDVARMRIAAVRLAHDVADLAADPTRLEALAGGRAASALSRLRHELRTPIAAILGYGELLAEEAEAAGDTAFAALLAEVASIGPTMLAGIDRLVSAAGATPVGEVEAVVDLPVPQVRGAVATGRILVVDDTPAIRDLLARRLVRDGHAVVTAASGTEALDLAEATPFDLVLLDVMMPGLSGVEVLHRLKRREEWLPVVVVSALDDVDTVVRCLDEGADDYLTKPVNTTILRSRIASSLDRKFLRDREQARLEELRAERERSEMLLRNVLPEAVVARLQRGERVLADHFDSVTVLFCDLVGFTALTAALPPGEVLALLNELFLGFDELAAAHGLEKIKTIGDAYMAAGGLAGSRADHAVAAARVALAMPGAAARVAAPRGLCLRLRIGLDTGPATAGIIGAQKFFYDLWGDTVNTASRMESLAEPGAIQITGAVRAALGPSFTTAPRGVVKVKGKGAMEVWLLAGEGRIA